MVESIVRMLLEVFFEMNIRRLIEHFFSSKEAGVDSRQEDCFRLLCFFDKVFASNIN